MDSPFVIAKESSSWVVVDYKCTFSAAGTSGSIVHTDSRAVFITYSGVYGTVNGGRVDVTLVIPITTLQEGLGFSMLSLDD